MYSEWVSISATAEAEKLRWSVLNKFPGTAGRDVVIAVVRPLVATLGINTGHCEQSGLLLDKEVQWTMEVVCFGLSLPMSEHEAIRDCVSVYCEWFLALTKPKACVPKPVCEDPNNYARRMLHHLYNLFVPRSEEASDINKQAVLCHRVLRTIQYIAAESTIIDRETWESLLLFLLATNDMLLAPPVVKDDIGSQLCERIISVLFEIWLLACHRCFPSPPLWKTFRELCCNWRHRVSLIDQWNHTCLALTSRVLQFMYGTDFPQVKLQEEDSHLVPVDMSNECIAQAWFRFLHTLGNPVDLCRPDIISQTTKFYHFALTSENVIDPCQHPCLAHLPQVFLKAMKGIATLVDAFLGIIQPENEHKLQTAISHSQTSSTPPHPRRSITKSIVSATSNKGAQKSGLMAGLSSKTGGGHHNQQLQPQNQYLSPINTPSGPTLSSLHLQLSPSRPKCNSVLHLFGAWLFEASLIGSELGVRSRSFDSLEGGTKRPSSVVLDGRQPMPQNVPDAVEIPSNLTVDNFEAGQAEAVGTLCRLFCSKRTGEEILPIYLARFYLSLQFGLSGGEISRGQVMSSILLNSCDLLRQDLDGVMVLVPHFLQALELVLPEGLVKIKPIPMVELRRASIHLLLSMLALPLHFGNLSIKDISSASCDKPVTTFQSLRPRLVNLLTNALQHETDSANTQMLLGGLLFCVQDSTASEEVEQSIGQNDSRSESVSSLLSSETTDAGEGNSSLSFQCSEFSSFEQGLDSSFNLHGPTSVSSNPDSAHGVFLRATLLICHRLMSAWQADLNVSLAALEVLSGLARIHLPSRDSLECKRAVKWICDFIVNQCSKPAKAHSKDLHSAIVAAYQCVTTWLTEHPDLLQDKETIHTVMEVVELGISGTKSQPKASDIPQFKGDKELKPASMRVKDAAEAVLACMLDHVGNFPPPSGAESLSSHLDEESILQLSTSWEGQLTKEEAIQHFSYFVVENCYIVALLEQHPENGRDPEPAVISLIRGPFGRHAWTLQLRHLPKHKPGNKFYAVNPGRPLPMSDVGIHYNVRPKCFPDNLERIYPCKADASIPTLETVINNHNPAEHEKLAKLLETQIIFEESVSKNTSTLEKEYPNPETECKAPSVCQDFQTARLLLSHLGFLSQEALKDSATQPFPSCILLDQSHSSFSSQLEALDNISTRSSDTVFIFYVKSGQTTASDILDNVLSNRNVHHHFLEFLRSLGWPVDVRKHAGWTGHVSTAWRVLPSSDIPDDLPTDHGGSLYSGHHQVLYWSDVSSEIAFVVPSQRTSWRTDSEDNQKDSDTDSLADVLLRTKGRFDVPLDRHSLDHPVEEDRTSLSSQSSSESSKPRGLSLSLEPSEGFGRTRPGSGHKFGRQFSSSSSGDFKVLVVWLESFEDHATFPFGDLVQETVTGLEPPVLTPRCSEKDIFIIFIHALQNGLFRIKMQGPSGRMTLALPLVDGMVVSRRTLGTLVRQTALNLCRRRRLDAESCLPPHVRRKLKIQEIVNRYWRKLSEPEFYTSLFYLPP
ncbi:ral GTPase-activating protein subunit beta isoform X2 [Tachypleus tridentatus]|uniref:ral GTPase-activating protein subunit beta isoform X2 n=1 Tax=Tachypleus tridentatus TaxID=6853 RepID=UPI003FD4BD69